MSTISSFEESYVHQVYSRLATYASSNPCLQVWPNVKKFLDSQTPGSVILDIGCGRAQHISNNCVTIGIDTCPDMILKVEKHNQMEILLANALNLPLKDDSMDGILCISILHHLSTIERRKQAINELARVLKPGARVIGYVWAFEQPNGIFKNQDVLVPFNLHEIAKSGQLPLVAFHKDSTKEERVINNSIPITVPEETCPRWFKSMFGTRLWKLLPSRQSIPPAIPTYLQQISVENVQQVFVSGIHRWSPALGRRLINVKVEHQLAQELSQKIMEEAYAEAMSTLRAVSYYRYYHVFRKGELYDLFSGTPEMVVEEYSYDSGNWYITARKRNAKSAEAVKKIGI